MEFVEPIDPAELKKQVGISKKSGVCTEELAKMFIILAEVVGSNFPFSAEDDRQEAILKLIEIIPMVDCRKPPKMIFSYLHQSVMHLFMRLNSSRIRDKATFMSYEQAEFYEINNSSNTQRRKLNSISFHGLNRNEL
jgi:hypothetical protein